MAELTYRDAVARGIAQEMTRDPDVIFFGEDVAKPGGVFKTTVGLYEQFGIGEEVIAAIEADVKRRVDEATEKCKAAPPPPLDLLTTDVYADGGFAWRN